MGKNHAISLLLLFDCVDQTIPGTFELVQRNHVLVGNYLRRHNSDGKTDLHQVVDLHIHWLD